MKNSKKTSNLGAQIGLIGIIVIVIFSILSNKMNAQEQFNIGIYSEPQHYTTSLNQEADGFNIGAHLEYTGRWIYTKAETYYFPQLNDINFLSLGGAVGFNYKPNQWRFFTGLVLGVVNRTKTHPYLGGEIGFTYKLNNSPLTIGTKYTYVARGDSKEWSNDSSFNVSNAGITISYTWDWRK
jgi:hypothetical protein